MHAAIDAFLAAADAATATSMEPADRVIAIAPLMRELLNSDRSFLTERITAATPTTTPQRHPYRPRWPPVAFRAGLAAGAMTPVHDHGSWGVVGVLEGLLEERAYMAADGDITADTGIRLRRGGVVLLNPGAVTSFVPNPDHIHMTGVVDGRRRGQPDISRCDMNSFAS